MKPWMIVVFVIVLYVHLFNAIAKEYFASDRKLDLFRRFVPPMKITIEV